MQHFQSFTSQAGRFYTDSNGRQSIERVRFHRPTFDVDPAVEPVTQNYYPVVNRITARDSDATQRSLSVMTDRTEAGSSQRDGQLELMVHRRLLFDDDFGVGEPLNEMAYLKGLVARGKHYVIADNNQEEHAARFRRWGNVLLLLLKKMVTYSIGGGSHAC
jgi:lysosomal alpha-mannosidase